LQKASALTSLENIALPAPTAQTGGSRTLKCSPTLSTREKFPPLLPKKTVDKGNKNQFKKTIESRYQI